MTFQEITVLSASRCHQDPDKQYFMITLYSPEIEQNVTTCIWKEHNPDLWIDLAYATHDLTLEDYPIDINIKVHGKIITMQAPKYVHNKECTHDIRVKNSENGIEWYCIKDNCDYSSYIDEPEEIDFTNLEF